MRVQYAISAVRKMLGPDVDLHAKFFTVSRAIRVAREIEPYQPLWLEDPIRPENGDALSAEAVAPQV